MSTNHLHSELELERGDVVVVELHGNAANVRLFDEHDYGRFLQRDHPIAQAGGHFDHSPVELQAPWPGKWHLVIDLGGHEGKVEAAVSVQRA